MSDLTLPIGAHVRSLDGAYTGIVTREYWMPHSAPDRSWGFWSHPGNRVYVIRLDNPNSPTLDSVAINARDLEITHNPGHTT